MEGGWRSDHPRRYQGSGLDVEGPTPEVKDPWGNIKIGASATTKLDRRDFGLVFNVALEAGGVMVGDEVAIELELELARQK
jgi:polyisoprenoid-binding protein YceI